MNTPRGGPLTLRSKSSIREARRTKHLRASGTGEVSASTPGASHEAVAGSSVQNDASAEPKRLSVEFGTQKRSPRLPCFTLGSRRERNNRFFGRDGIFALIDDSLLPSDQTKAGASATTDDDILPRKNAETCLKSFALCGIGGSGKTEVAVEYAYRRERDFDAVFWVAADNKDILTEEFARIAVALELVDTSEPTDLLASCDLVKGWLSNPVKTYEETPPISNEASWLLIFDNADRPDVLEDFWPATGLGSVLVTSRDIHAKDQTYTANVGIDIAPFSVEESSDMMQQLLPSNIFDGQEDFVREIANKLGGLPLLLTQMSGMMTRLRLSCKDFLRLCEERDIEHLDWLGDETTRSAQVFKISTNLGLDGLSAESLALLRMSSLLDPDYIPDDVLIKALNQKLARYFPSTYKGYCDARLELQQSSLVGCNRTTGDLTLHRIVQDVTLANMSQTERLELLHATIQAVSAAWPFVGLQDRFNTDRYPVCAKIFPSVVRLKETQSSMLNDDECKDTDAAASLFSDSGW